MSYLAKPKVHHPSLKRNSLGLTRREFRLLQVLARQQGRIFSRARLLALSSESSSREEKRSSR